MRQVTSALLATAALSSAPPARRPPRPAGAAGRKPAPPPPAWDGPDDLGCAHFLDCSGCSRAGAFDATPIAERCQALFEPLLGASVDIFCGPATGWRRQARLAAAPGTARIQTRGKRGRKAYSCRAHGSADGSRRRRGCRVAATPRLPGRGDAAAATRIFREDESQRRRGDDVDIRSRRRGCDSVEGGGLRYRTKEVGLGLYRTKSHAVVSIPDCQAHAPELNDAAAAVRAACAAAGIAAVNSEGEGSLRYVQFSLEAATKRVALSLVWNERSAKDAQPELPRLVKALEATHDWHSIWANFRGDKPGNAIFNNDPRAWSRLRGSAHVVEGLFDGTSLDTIERGRADGLDTDLNLRFSPLVFRQANLAGFAGLVANLAAWVPDGADVCELYAGVGAMGLALRPKCRRVRCSESNPNAPDGFELAKRDQERRLGNELPPRAAASEELPPGTLCAAAAAAPRPMRFPDAPRCGRGGAVPDTLQTLGPRRCRLRVLDAADAIRVDSDGADLLLVDPPRRGLCADVLEALVEGDNPGLTRVVYVSCGFDALQRDADALLQSGRWKVAHAEGHVLFPGSDHVETLAVFDAV